MYGKHRETSATKLIKTINAFFSVWKRNIRPKSSHVVISLDKLSLWQKTLSKSRQNSPFAAYLTLFQIYSMWFCTDLMCKYDRAFSRRRLRLRIVSKWLAPAKMLTTRSKLLTIESKWLTPAEMGDNVSEMADNTVEIADNKSKLLTLDKIGARIGWQGSDNRVKIADNTVEMADNTVKMTEDTVKTAHLKRLQVRMFHNLSLLCHVLVVFCPKLNVNSRFTRHK